MTQWSYPRDDLIADKICNIRHTDIFTDSNLNQVGLQKLFEVHVVFLGGRLLEAWMVNIRKMGLRDEENNEVT